MNSSEQLSIFKKNPEYWAGNGHMMITTQWTPQGRRIQHSAQHSPNCPCNGEALPDE